MAFVNKQIVRIAKEGNEANYGDQMPHVTPQCHMIIAYMNRHGSITQMEASEDLGITKLSTRISDMVKAGVRGINKTYEEGVNRWGQKCHYMRYSLDRSVWH